MKGKNIVSIKSTLKLYKILVIIIFIVFIVGILVCIRLKWKLKVSHQLWFLPTRTVKYQFLFVGLVFLCQPK